MKELKKLLALIGIVLLGCGIFSIFFGIYVFGLSYFSINIGMVIGFGLSIGGIILLISAIWIKL